MNQIDKIFNSALEDSVSLRNNLLLDVNFRKEFKRACEVLLATRLTGGTIYACGNGGSACDAMHFTEELVARYAKERIGFKAQHFMDVGTMTCWANDYSYETIFSRQVETFCTSKDVLIVFTTSGNSANILNALRIAKEKMVPSIFLGGKDGGKAKNLADISLIVPANRTDRIQELHITLVHCFCEFLELDF